MILSSKRKFLEAARTCEEGISGNSWGFLPSPWGLWPFLCRIHWPLGQIPSSQHCLAHGNSDWRLEFSWGSRVKQLLGQAVESMNSSCLGVVQGAENQLRAGEISRASLNPTKNWTPPHQTSTTAGCSPLEKAQNLYLLQNSFTHIFASFFSRIYPNIKAPEVQGFFPGEVVLSRASELPKCNSALPHCSAMMFASPLLKKRAQSVISIAEVTRKCRIVLAFNPKTLPGIVRNLKCLQELFSNADFFLPL